MILCLDYICENPKEFENAVAKYYPEEGILKYTCLDGYALVDDSLFIKYQCSCSTVIQNVTCVGEYFMSYVALMCSCNVMDFTKT